MLLATRPRLQLVCPRCRQGLERRDGSYHCGGCDGAYPVVAGIADFRITPDPWLGIEEDRIKAGRLETAIADMSFEDAVRTYWRMTPDTPAHLAARFTDHVLHAEQRTREWLERGGGGAPGSAELPWLDLGCGTADLAAAVPAGTTVVSVDIALRWLVVARRRGGAVGGALLICADAAHLPFAAGSFSRASSLGMLEHCQDAARVLAEAHRVLAPGGVLSLRTTNRFTALSEPHVGVWGVGWLPRRWADRYVRLRTGQSYRYHRPRSARELNAALRQAGFQQINVGAAAVLPSERARLPALASGPLRVYEALQRRRGVRLALTFGAPLLEALAVK